MFSSFIYQLIYEYSGFPNPAPWHTNSAHFGYLPFLNNFSGLGVSSNELMS